MRISLRAVSLDASLSEVEVTVTSAALVRRVPCSRFLPLPPLSLYLVAILGIYVDPDRVMRLPRDVDRRGNRECSA